MRYRMFFAVFCLLLLSKTALADNEPVTIAVHDYPPYYDHNGNGCLSDLYRAAFKTQGIAVTFWVLPIERSVVYFFSNKVDAHSPGNIFFTPEQVKQADCIKTFKITATWFCYTPRQKKIPFTSLDSMKGYRLGVIVNSPYQPLYDAHGLRTYSVQTPAQLVKKVYAGRDDFFEATFFSGLVMIGRIFPTEWEHFDYTTWDMADAGLAFLKNNVKARNLKRAFDKGFTQIKENGTYVKIMEQYWGKNNIPRSVLPDELSSFGTQKFSSRIFHKATRNDYFKIITP